MTHSSNLAIALGAAGAMFGVVFYRLLRLKLDQASLRRLISESFSDRKCPVPIPLVHKTKRGPISFYEAYRDTAESGLILLIGRIARGNVSYSTASGVVPGGRSMPWALGIFKPGAGSDFLEAVRPQRHVVLATIVAGGALVVWDDRPSRTSALRHLEQLR